MRIALALLMAALLLFISCGTPNPFDLEDATNQPLKVETTSFGKKISIKIHGYNPAYISPNFSGYNIYFSEIDSENEIQNQYIYGNYGSGREVPTIREFANDAVKVTSFDINGIVK